MCGQYKKRHLLQQKIITVPKSCALGPKSCNFSPNLPTSVGLADGHLKAFEAGSVATHWPGRTIGQQVSKTAPECRPCLRFSGKNQLQDAGTGHADLPYAPVHKFDAAWCTGERHERRWCWAFFSVPNTSGYHRYLKLIEISMQLIPTS